MTVFLVVVLTSFSLLSSASLARALLFSSKLFDDVLDLSAGVGAAAGGRAGATAGAGTEDERVSREEGGVSAIAMMPARALRGLTSFSLETTGAGAAERKGEGGSNTEAAAPCDEERVEVSSTSGERGWATGLLRREEDVGREVEGLEGRGADEEAIAEVTTLRGAEAAGAALERVLAPGAGTGESSPRSPRKSATSFARFASRAARSSCRAKESQYRAGGCRGRAYFRLRCTLGLRGGGGRVDWPNEILLGILAVQSNKTISKTVCARERGSATRVETSAAVSPAIPARKRWLAKSLTS